MHDPIPYAADPSGVAARAARDTLVGRTFNGRFRIMARLAKGGMGRVYLAVQEPLGREVALKVLHAGVAADDRDAFHRRFFTEAATAAKLTHPHSVTIFDYGRSDDGIYYIAMEYLRGQSLRTLLRCAAPLRLHRAVHIGMQIARALRQAHALGFMHRDLKPANVMLLADDDGRDFVKVVDFGLAKAVYAVDDLTHTGQFLGSPGYMAPEQIRGEALDTRCDIYALGALLFEMLAGRPPLTRSAPVQTLMAHVHEPVPTFASVCPGLVLPAELEQLVQACLRKRPQDRPQNLTAVLAALDDSLRALGPGQTPWPNKIRPVAASMPATAATGDHPGAGPGGGEPSGWAVVPSTGALGRCTTPALGREVRDCDAASGPKAARAGDGPAAAVDAADGGAQDNHHDANIVSQDWAADLLKDMQAGEVPCSNGQSLGRWFATPQGPDARAVEARVAVTQYAEVNSYGSCPDGVAADRRGGDAAPGSYVAALTAAVAPAALAHGVAQATAVTVIAAPMDAGASGALTLCAVAGRATGHGVSDVPASSRRRTAAALRPAGVLQVSGRLRWSGAMWRALICACLAALCRGQGPAELASGRQHTVLRLRSLPAGAGVFIGDTLLCGATPCDVSWKPSGDGHSICLRFAAAGYEEYVTSRRLPVGSQPIVAGLTPQVSEKDAANGHKNLDGDEHDHGNL